ncbi:MAG: hypothetical protein LUC47_00100 [Clostridiales bacterium]|nr:hypothetical protein [Clostridiales bacterium]
MKTFTIIGGVNGVGKSSLTGVLKGQLKDLGIIIDVDKIAATKAGGDNLKGGRIAVRRIQDCLDKGICFTQETTLNGFTTAKRASAAGYHIRLFYVGLDSLEESLQRIENRVAHGGHDIPTDTVKRRFSSRWSAVADVLPYCDEAVFYDNYNGFVEVAEYRNGELLLKGDYRPAWVLELQTYLAGQ